MRVAILGSCISRDIFRIVELNSLVKEYRARTSIHSLVETVAADLSQIKLPSSNFQAKMITSDFEKRSLDFNNCDFLIIDLIDERFDIISNFNSTVTFSNELRNNNENLQPNIIVKRGTRIEYEMWRQSIKKLKYMIDIPIILHKSRLSNKINENDSGVEINHNYINMMNERMEKYEQIIYQELNIIGTIDVPTDLLISDVNHIWGYSPYHYVKEYYFEAMKRVFEITKIDKRSGLLKSNFEVNIVTSANEVTTNVTAKDGVFKYAYYIFQDNNLIHKEWYSDSSSFTYTCRDSIVNSVSVVVYARNIYNDSVELDCVFS